MEDTIVSAATSRNEESETRSGEWRHAEFELEHDHKRDVATSASRNEESNSDSDDSDSDGHDKGNRRTSTSRNEEDVAISDEENKNRSVPTSTSKNEESDTDSSSSESNAGDADIEQEQINTSSGDLSVDVVDALTFTEEKDDGERDVDTNTWETQSTQTFTDEKDEGERDGDTNMQETQTTQTFTDEKDEGERDGDTNMQETQSSPEAFAEEHYVPSLPIDEVVTGSMEIAPETADDSNKPVLGDTAGATVSTSKEKNMQETQSTPEAFADDHYESSLQIDEVGSTEIAPERGDDSNKQVLGDNAGVLVSTPEERNEGDEENRPSSSRMNVTSKIVPESLEFDEHSLHDPLHMEHAYVKKGSTCDGNAEEDDEEQLREYWTRALQTSTSTGEFVEEIVKVLKHHQKTHDLLCPVCGSCVTRRVILRRRKRSSLISVDRWYQDPLDEAEVQEQGSSLKVKEAVEERDAQEDQDTEAFGCLSCFSLFFEKGRRFFNQLQADIGPDNFNCLPFFFPPYPWGMMQMKPKRPGLEEEASTLEVIEELEEPSTTDVKSSFSCGIGSTLLPGYPWGTMPLLSKGLHEEGSSSEEVEEAVVSDVQESLATVPQSDYTCGIGSTLFPDYPWGAMPYLSKGEVIPNQTDTVKVEEARDVSQSEAIEETSQPLLKERTCTCGLAPALLPAYPWGHCTKSESSGEQIQGPEPVGAISGESTCTCGLAPALFPDYSWGYMSKIEEVARQSPSNVEAGPKDSSSTQVDDTILQAASQHEISEEVPQLHREGRSCTCGLLPALLPEYPWGFLMKDQGAYHAQASIVAQAQPVEEMKGKGAEDKGPSCVSAVLPDYPWGMTTESEEVLEEGPSLRENRKSRLESMPAILPSYPWGVCSVNQSVHEQNGSAQTLQGTAGRDCTCGLGPAMLPKFPWGQTLSTAGKQNQAGIQQVQSYTEQETKIEARITSKTDVFTVTTSKLTYPGEKPPKNIKTMIPQQTSQTVQHLKLDQTVTVLNASVKVEEVPANKGSSLVSLPSTGFALLDMVEEGLAEKGRLETRPSTGYAHLEEIHEEAESTGKDTAKLQERPTKNKVSKVIFSPTTPASPHTHYEPFSPAMSTSAPPHTYYEPFSPATSTSAPPHTQNEPFSPATSTSAPPHSHYEPEPSESEIKEDPMSLKYTQQSIPAEIFHNPGKTRPQLHPSGTQFPSFQWSVGKLDAGDLTTPLLKASVESEAETFISILKPSPGVDEPNSENWLSVFKVSKPPDEEGIMTPLLSTMEGYIEEIEEVKLPVVRPQTRPQIPSVTEAVIDVPPGDLGGTSLGTATSTAVVLPPKKTKEADEWDILKSIVYGGLDISVASLGVTSSAAGGNAITRTVVYMGLATLLSGLIGFYHNVLNLYHYHRDHYTEVVGVSLMLHGTVALISYLIFGLLSPLSYAFSYRETDDRDEKFMLCCGVTILAVTALALGKARVSNKRYLRTLFSYLLGGVLAAIIGYLTGEHVSELLEEWGL